MMAASKVFSLLPPLNEGDEHISLCDMLEQRDSCLTETECWALIHDCCQALQHIHTASLMFQNLCITPDSLAFDLAGNVCYLDLPTDPEEHYIAPEYESVGNSSKSHLFSLGMTILFAAEYAALYPYGEHLSEKLTRLLYQMIEEAYETRCDIHQVILECQRNLDGRSSKQICKELVACAKLQVCVEDDCLSLRSASSLTDAAYSITPPLDFIDSDSDVLNGYSSESPSRFDSPINLCKTPTLTESPSSGKNSPVRISPKRSSIRDTIGLVSPFKQTRVDSTHLVKQNCRSEDRASPISHQVSPPVKTSPTVSPAKISLPVIPTRTLSCSNSLSLKRLSQGTNKNGVTKVTELMNKNNPLHQKILRNNSINVSHSASSCEKKSALDALNKTGEEVINIDFPPCVEALPHDVDETTNLRENKLVNGDNVISPHDTKTNGCTQTTAVDIVTDANQNELNSKLSCDLPNSELFIDNSYVTDGDNSVINIDCSASVTNNDLEKDNSASSFGSEGVICDRQTDGHTDQAISPHNLEYLSTDLSRDEDSSFEHTFVLNSSALLGVDLTHAVAASKTSTPIGRSLLQNKAAIGRRAVLASPLHGSVNDLNASPDTSTLRFMRRGGHASPAPAPTLRSARPITANLHACHTAVHTPSAPTSAESSLVPPKPASEEDDNSDTLLHRGLYTREGENQEGLPHASSAHIPGEGGDDAAPGQGHVRGLRVGLHAQASAAHTRAAGSPTRPPTLSLHWLAQHCGDAHVLDTSYTHWRRQAPDMAHSALKTDSVAAILERLGMGLQEHELWALCRETVVALVEHRHHRPPYVAPETVMIDRNGFVSFMMLPEDQELDCVFLAPELQRNAIVTEKTCLFGLGATLWTSADYNLPANHEPVLSAEFEHLLMALTQEESEHRPSALHIIQICNDHEKKESAASNSILQTVLRDAHKAQCFTADNVLIKNLLREEDAQHLKQQRDRVIDDIRAAPLTLRLRPVCERRLAEAPPVELSLHDRLMQEIKNPSQNLRQTVKPTESSVRDIFLSNPDLLKRLQLVTRHNRLAAESTSFHDDVSSTLPTSPDGSRVDLISSKNGVNNQDSGMTPASDPMPEISASLSPSAGILTNTNSAFKAPPKSPKSVIGRDSHTPPRPLSGGSQSNDPKTPPATYKSPPGVPEAFTSPTTHFSPIVLKSSDAAVRVRNDLVTSPSETEKKVAQQILQLKKNLMKNRQPLNFARDLEKEVANENVDDAKRTLNFEDRLKDTDSSIEKTPPEQKSDSSFASSSSQRSASHSDGSNVSERVVPNAGVNEPTVVVSGNVPPSQSMSQTGQHVFQTNQMTINPNANVTNMSVPSSHNTATNQRDDSQKVNYYPNLAQQMQPQYANIQPEYANIQQNNAGLIMPNHPVGFPVQFNPAMLGGFPFQVQLQLQDAAKGVFNLIPVGMATMPVQQVDGTSLSSSDGGSSKSETRKKEKRTPREVKRASEAKAASRSEKNKTRPSGASKESRSPSTKSRSSSKERSSSRERSSKKRSTSRERSSSKERSTSKDRLSSRESSVSRERSSSKERSQISKSQSSSVETVSDLHEQSDQLTTKSKAVSKASSSCDKDRVVKRSETPDAIKPSPEQSFMSPGEVLESEDVNPCSTDKRGLASTADDVPQRDASHDSSSHKSALDSPAFRGRDPLDDSYHCVNNGSTSVSMTTTPPNEYSYHLIQNPSFSASAERGNNVNNSSVCGSVSSSTSARSDLSDASLRTVIHRPVTRGQQLSPGAQCADGTASSSSPPPSPSLSKDSGVSGLNLRSSAGGGGGQGYRTLMDRLLDADAVKHQQKLGRVIQLIREEFAFDGYLENGVEDLAMAEYVVSLANLKWDTFSSAITEKYCDLYWQDELLVNLYETVNGCRPDIPSKKAITPSSIAVEKLASETARVLSIDEPSPKTEKFIDTQLSLLQQGHMTTEKDADQSSPSKRSEVTEVMESTYATSSAFRPIRSPSKGQQIMPTFNTAGLLKPRPVKGQSYTDTSDSTDSEARERKRTRFRKKTNMDKAKSSSMHNLVHPPELTVDNDRLTKKSRSQDALDSSVSESKIRTDVSAAKKPSIKRKSTDEIDSNNTSANKVTASQVRSSDSENESNTDAISPVVHRHPVANDKLSKNCTFLIGKSEYESDSSSATDHTTRRAPLGASCEKAPALVRGTSHVHNDSLSSRDSYHLAEKSSSNNDSSQDASGNLDYSFESHLEDLSSGSDAQTNAAPSVLKGSIVYYNAEMEALRPDIKEFSRQMDGRSKEGIENKMAEIKQQLTMEIKQKRKTQKFYVKLLENSKTNKASSDQRSMVVKVSKQLAEMQDRVHFLQSAKKHMQMLHAEQYGIDACFLVSLTEASADIPLTLTPSSDNPLIQYQTVKNTDSIYDSQILHAGMPAGLMAYLFSRGALAEGYIHQFFFCYRYICTPLQLFDYLSTIFIAASKSLHESCGLVRTRAVDIFQIWLEGYFSVDYRDDAQLRERFRTFITDNLCHLDCVGDHLLHMFTECCQGNHQDLLYADTVAWEDAEVEMMQDEYIGQPKKWESLKAALHLSARPTKLTRQKTKIGVASCMDRRRRESEGGVYFPKVARRTDAFTLADYTSQALAEQLTLMEQDLFRRSHPVHYLNSRAQGVGVAMATQTLNRAMSTTRLNSAWGDHQEESLFAGGHMMPDYVISSMITHSQRLAYWVAAEIISCGSLKAQTALISKFIYTAKLCKEWFNYAVCVSIMEGLENIVVKNLPAWRSLPSKCLALKEELSSVKFFLKSDSLCFMKNECVRRHPTIPCVHLFLLHVQQQEIGGFTLANGMYKWAKMRSISKVVDQIRIFKEHSYIFEADVDLQDSIQQRMREFSEQELQMLVPQGDTFPKTGSNSSSSKFHSAIRKMKMKGRQQTKDALS